MEEMKIMIIHCLDYEKDGKKNSVLEYLLLDKDSFENTDKSIGYSPISSFYNKHIRELITAEMIGKPVTGSFQTMRGRKNPLTSFTKLVSIDYNGKTIDLL